jgi:hypothetical protein
MKSIETFISDIISEASLDARIPSGVIDLKNVDHIQVIAERIYDACENEQVVSEFLNNFINEGKYPERQAFNKDGWLVTFPSKEYRDAALKKGTHSISDPTHGKGGMNLYYKKKGKQKRQTQQATTAIDTRQQQTAQPVKQQSTTQTTTEKPSVPSADQSSDAAARAKRLASLSGKKPAQQPEKQAADVPAQQPVVQKPTSSEKPEQVPDSPKPADIPSIDVPVVTTPSPQYALISKKFAQKKGWMSEPYGEYRDREGNTVAVVGLSGEVVPIKSVDRDEYKLFAEKSMV